MGASDRGRRPDQRGEQPRRSTRADLVLLGRELHRGRRLRGRLRKRRQAMVATETSGAWAQATQVAAPTNAVSIVPSDPHAEIPGDLVLVGGQLHRRRHLRRHPPAGDGGHRDLGDLGASDRSRRPDQRGERSRRRTRGDLVFLGGKLHGRRGPTRTAPVRPRQWLPPRPRGRGLEASELAFPANGSSLNSLGSRVRRRGTAPPSGATPTVPGKARPSWPPRPRGPGRGDRSRRPDQRRDRFRCLSRGDLVYLGGQLHRRRQYYPHVPGHGGHRDLGDLGAGDRGRSPHPRGRHPRRRALGDLVFLGGNCTAVGSYDDTSGNGHAMVDTETSGTWAQASELALPTNAGAIPALISAGSRVRRRAAAPPLGLTKTPPTGSPRPWWPLSQALRSLPTRR